MSETECDLSPKTKPLEVIPIIGTNKETDDAAWVIALSDKNLVKQAQYSL